MRTYHNPEEKDDRNTNEDAGKSDDHAVDALRYVVAKIIKRTG
jgi:hypothetical protein